MNNTRARRLGAPRRPTLSQLSPSMSIATLCPRMLGARQSHASWSIARELNHFLVTVPPNLRTRCLGALSAGRGSTERGGGRTATDNAEAVIPSVLSTVRSLMHCDPTGSSNRLRHSDLFEEPHKVRAGRNTHSSICVQEGQPPGLIDLFDQGSKQVRAFGYVR